MYRKLQGPLAASSQMASRSRFLQQAVLLQLVAQAPDHVELGVDADRVADQAELLRGDDGGDPRMNRVSRAASPVFLESGGVRVVVDNRQNLVELLHLELLARLGNLALLVDDPAQSGFIPVLEVYLLAFRRNLHHLFDVPLDRAPAVIDVDAPAKNDDSFEAVAVLLQNHADERGGLPRLARTYNSAIESGGRASYEKESTRSFINWPLPFSNCPQRLISFIFWTAGRANGSTGAELDRSVLARSKSTRLWVYMHTEASSASREQQMMKKSALL